MHHLHVQRVAQAEMRAHAKGSQRLRAQRLTDFCLSLGCSITPDAFTHLHTGEGATLQDFMPGCISAFQMTPKPWNPKQPAAGKLLLRY